MSLPALSEETCAPGTPLNPYQHTYTPEAIQQYINRTGETAQMYRIDGQQYAPTGMFLGAYGRLIHETFHYEAGVHVSSEMQLTRAAREHETVTVSGNALRLWERNGDKYITFEVIITGQDGGPLARVEHTSIYALRKRAAG